MSLLQPSSCSCFDLKLPKLSTSDKTTLDEMAKRKLTLDCRTGAAVTIVRSNIFVHGGLTIPLNLNQVNSVTIQKELIIYFSKQKSNVSNFRKLDDWISSETFFLDLISRVWKRVEVFFTDGRSAAEKEVENKSNDNNTDSRNGSNDTNLEKDDDRSLFEFKERLYHSMCFAGSSLYIFGGLVVSPQSGYELIATNELWRLDLQSKQWTLISKDPQITRRFTHSMHTLNNDNDKDTKLVIVGGLNNIDKPIYHIDIFNLTTNTWETESGSSNFISNCESEEISILSESNFSILIENNEAKIPTLALYAPNDSVSSDIEADNFEIDRKESSDPSSSIVALPLMQGAQGMRMNSRQGHMKHLEIPYSLQFPTGDYFGYTIIIAGFYPTCEVSNFRCFVYDTSTQQWTVLGIMCDDSDVNKHRFWKLLTWQSHHQTLLLGTKNDDYSMPSVQRFDFLLSFDLPMISIYNRKRHNDTNQRVLLNSSISQKNTPSRCSSIAPEALDPIEPEQQAFRKPSYASSATSQFESYIRYIAPASEMTSIRTVFPPYAMVLGKDALEIFGNPISDFEFVTDEGDSISVPLYLLRKRWGRYFDMILSQGYVRSCAEYENSGQASEFLKFSPHSSQVSYPMRGSEMVSRGSFETYLHRRHSQQEESDDPRSYSINIDPHQGNMDIPRMSTASDDLNTTPPFFEHDEEDPVSPPSRSQKIEPLRACGKSGAVSTTSSSGGMIFRVPFQENRTAALSDTMLSKKEDREDKRRSSSVAAATLDHLKLNVKSDRWRRASHPDSWLPGPDELRSHHTSKFLSPSAQNSRRASSIASHSSSISYVSSSSDRMGNSIYPGSGNGSSVASSFLGVLNVALPPQEQSPTDALPIPPEIPNSGSKRDSFSEYVFPHSSKSSPFPSRRASHDTTSTLSDLRQQSDQFQPSLDKQMMDESQFLESSADYTYQQKHTPGKATRKSTENGINFYSKVPRNSETKRLSLESYAESTDSVNSIEWEPLLTPRTLYMPWPTATVRAFAEFFFTGQINGRWMLAPVVLNLLIMSKIYEIPLLYNLITEVLYAIIARKEDSLCVTCDSLIDALRNKILRLSDDDHELVDSFLTENETFNELLKLKKSLDNIDNGYFDVDLIKKVSRGFSASTNSDSAPEKQNVSGTFNTRKRSSTLIPTVFAGGPRDSHNSVGSIGYPPNFRQATSTLQRMNNKSSLSKEINIDTGSGDNFNHGKVDTNGENNGRSNIICGNETAQLKEDSEDTNSDSSSDSSSDETEDEYEDAVHEAPYENSVNQEGTIIDARTNTNNDYTEEDVREGLDAKIDELNIIAQKTRSDADSGSSLSDSDGLNSDIGLLSLNKMKRKIAGQNDLEESIDPLFKVAFEEPPSEKGDVSQENLSTARSARDDGTSYGLTTPTLENLASPNALPPVDYVIKSIYRTAALINYPRLMVRCLDCIEISKRLRTLQKRAILDLSEIEGSLGKSGILSHEIMRRKVLEKQKSDSALSETMSTRPNPSTKISAPDMSTFSRSSESCSTQLNPMTIREYDVPKNLKSASQGSVGPYKKSIKNKIFGDSPTTPSNTAVLMNSAFMPPPPNSNRGKRSNAGQSAGAFSFFGKKK